MPAKSPNRINVAINRNFVIRVLENPDKLIANHEVIGTRIVHGHKGDRYEIVFSNQLKLKTNFKLYTAYPIKLPEAYLNY